MLPALASSSQGTEGEATISAYSYISRASAAQAIQHLDSYAFPSTPSSSSPSSSPRKRKKVSEVGDDSTSGKMSRFSNMAGLSHLHRERARQRQSERLSMSEKKEDKDRRANKMEQATTFQPFSLPLLLERLATLSISTYSSKPENCRRLDPVALAMQGWNHKTGTERDVLTCATCQAEWKVEVVSGLSASERENAWKSVDESVPSRHLHWCPWKLRGCHPSLYRVHVYSRMETLTEYIRTSKELASCSGIDEVKVTSSISDVDQLALRQLTLDAIPTSCLLLTLLGWKLKDGSILAQDCIVQCSMCSRKIGLWGFLKDHDGSRTLDVVKEHKSFCPFINAKTQNPTGQKTGEQMNAWQQRLQVLLGAGHDGSTRRLPLSQEEVRKMRTSEVLAKVKSLMM